MTINPSNDRLLDGLPQARPDAARAQRTRSACRAMLNRRRGRASSSHESAGAHAGKLIAVVALAVGGALYVAELVAAAMAFRNVLP